LLGLVFDFWLFCLACVFGLCLILVFTWFYLDCEKKGIEVYVDTDLLIPHFQDYKWDELVKKIK